MGNGHSKFSFLAFADINPLYFISPMQSLGFIFFPFEIQMGAKE
jgi:hypothetical protein